MRSILFVGAAGIALVLLLCVAVGLGRLDLKLEETQYRWFQEAGWVMASQQKKLAHLQVLINRIDELEKIGKVGRVEENQRELWKQSVSQIVVDYNTLAKEYNYRMAKLKWKFCEKQSLPTGFTEPLQCMFQPIINPVVLVSQEGH
jgi:hypothetical protein